MPLEAKGDKQQKGLGEKETGRQITDLPKAPPRCLRKTERGEREIRERGEGDRETFRHTDRQTDRQTNKQTDIQSQTTEALCCHGGRDKFLNCFSSAFSPD